MGQGARTVSMRILGGNWPVFNAMEELLHELKKRVTILFVAREHLLARVYDDVASVFLGEMIKFGKADEIIIERSGQTHRKRHHGLHGLTLLPHKEST